MGSIELPRVLTVRELGYDQLRALQREDELEWIRRGAYRRPATMTSPSKVARENLLARCVAVADRLTTRFAFSHATAAVLHGWPAPVDPHHVEIVQVVSPNRCGRSDIRRHVRTRLLDSDIVEIAGLPVTAPLPTVIDCARAFSPREGLVTVDKALQLLAGVDKFDRERSLASEATLRAELYELLAAMGASRNVVRARAVLEHATGLSGSPQESSLRWLALAVGLPEPICEWEQNIDGRQLFSDLAWLKSAEDWPTRAITFEYDGVAKYGATSADILRAVADEKEREDSIRAAGVAVHRVMRSRLVDLPGAAAWMVSRFPPSVRSSLTPRPALKGPLRRTS